jgi:putative peptidoglycan lipid II flippase
MSDQAIPITPASITHAPATRPRSFVYHAKVISALTFGSRVLGVIRESLAARYFGAGVVSTAFALAFTIPNLFRRLLGEGALSSAFIPLYAQAVKADELQARRFAASAVNLLALILLAITLLGEILIAAILLAWNLPPDHRLTLKLTAVMLPYVMLICGAAFLGGILQVHKRFGVTAATPIVLNLLLIASTIIGVRLWADPHKAIYFVAASVLLAGVLQLLMLVPPLRAVGFRFDPLSPLRTPQVRQMLRLSIPVALGAGVLQLSVVIDKAVAYFLSQRLDQAHNVITHFNFFGQSVPYPMQIGAVARLSWAQFLYQFPLGVFAIALATAIFPVLSADALENDKRKFLAGLRQGLRVTLWEGLPASLGLIIVAQPAVQFLFEGGRFEPRDTQLVAASVRLYAVAIWAFSLQQILGKAYYALHDTRTPLLLTVLTLLVNLIVQQALLWSGMGEAAMAAGTAVSFIIQAMVSLALLRSKLGALELGGVWVFALKAVLATAVMGLACWAVQKLPPFPKDLARATALTRLLILIITGAAAYFAACAALGIWAARVPPARAAQTPPPRSA